MRIKKVLIYFSFFIFHFSFVYAQSPEIEKFFNSAAEKYLNKDWEGSISDLKKVIKLDPGNLRALSLLSRSLINYAQDLRKKGQLEEALGFVDEAIKYSPDFVEALNMKEELKKEIEKQRESYIEEKKRREYEARRRKEEEEQRKKMQQEYAKKLEAERRQREEREKKLREEMEKYKKEVEARKEEVALLRKQMKMIATNWLITFSIAVLIVIVANYLISSKIISSLTYRMRREIAESGDKIAELMNEVSRRGNVSEQLKALKEQNEELMRKLAEAKSPVEEKLAQQIDGLIGVIEKSAGKGTEELERVEFDEEKPRKIITDISSQNRARAKSIEAIAKTINEPSLAARLIAPFLDDSNNRVKATACVHMFKYDSVTAERKLKEMVDSDDRWMRASAAWACGEIADLSVMSFLEILIEDLDAFVRDSALRACKKAEEILKAKFPATLRVKVQRKLK